MKREIRVQRYSVLQLVDSRFVLGPKKVDKANDDLLLGVLF